MSWCTILRTPLHPHKLVYVTPDIGRMAAACWLLLAAEVMRLIGHQNKIGVGGEKWRVRVRMYRSDRCRDVLSRGEGSSPHSQRLHHIHPFPAPFFAPLQLGTRGETIRNIFHRYAVKDDPTTFASITPAKITQTKKHKIRLLAPSPELSDLIRDIGVEQVNHPGVIARFVLPELGTVPPDDRHKLLHHIRERWAELKQDQALIDQFKEVNFGLVDGGRGTQREKVYLNPCMLTPLGQEEGGCRRADCLLFCLVVGLLRGVRSVAKVLNSFSSQASGGIALLRNIVWRSVGNRRHSQANLAHPRPLCNTFCTNKQKCLNNGAIKKL